MPRHFAALHYATLMLLSMIHYATLRHCHDVAFLDISLPRCYAMPPFSFTITAGHYDTMLLIFSFFRRFFACFAAATPPLVDCRAYCRYFRLRLILLIVFSDLILSFSPFAAPLRYATLHCCFTPCRYAHFAFDFRH